MTEQVTFLILCVLVGVVLASRARVPIVYDVATRYSNVSLQDRGILETKLTSTKILKSHNIVSSPTIKNFKGATFAFVTPWNKGGYDAAKKFAAKFDYISPVWYQFKASADRWLETRLTGDDGVDEGYLAAMRHPAPPDGFSSTIRPPKIVPRVLLDGWFLGQFFAAARSSEVSASMAARLADLCRRRGFDGITLDFGAVAFTAVPESIEAEANMAQAPAYRFLSEISKPLRADGRLLFIAIPPERGYRTILGTSELGALAPLVDGVILMTYDYSSPQNPGPNAPLPWVRVAAQQAAASIRPRDPAARAPSLFVGLNLYGMTYCSRSPSGPILGPAYLKVLSINKPTFTWDPQTSEHTGTYTTASGDQCRVMYPTPLSIATRLTVAEEITVAPGATPFETGGVALWEIGQGLDYFYDLF